MIIRKAEFYKTAVNKSQYPEENKPEIAFVGRSNVGKSSLINTMLNRRTIAKVSSQPGKTRTINFFNINDLVYFVDLPGYGYAKVSKDEKNAWGRMIEEYLFTRKTLLDVVLLLDIRHEPTGDDKLMYDWIKQSRNNATIVATKCDKISKGQYQKHMSMIKKSLKIDEEDRIVLFSSGSKMGREELWALFENMLFVESQAEK